ncbi:NifB/NifX family molybdenum-iron cluster-binding protein [Methanomethylophilus alvi]|uniref:NifB/NifX family molybdenum-iron cluster-binding protein n=1 Tax=Methanomethylophilus alvi TaxID=1291540 RepID=UPI0037DC12D7
MRIAVSYDEGEVSRHFGSSDRFKLYETDYKDVVDTRIIENPARGHDAVIDVLAPYSIDAVISGSVCTAGARRMESMGITVYSGIKGDADGKVKELLEGKLLSDREKMSRSDSPSCETVKQGRGTSPDPSRSFLLWDGGLHEGGPVAVQGEGGVVTDLPGSPVCGRVQG